jgi:hypothetical protein
MIYYKHKIITIIFALLNLAPILIVLNYEGLDHAKIYLLILNLLNTLATIWYGIKKDKENEKQNITHPVQSYPPDINLPNFRIDENTNTIHIEV